MNTREKIMDVALHMFSERGYEAVSIRDICGEVGIKESTLYYHFKNKKDILDSLVEKFRTHIDGLLTHVDEITENPGIGPYKSIDEKIAGMACKASVKGGDRIGYEQAEKLIDELLTLDNPYNCPHGRPTIISMSRTDMEKKFKRIVD